MTEARFRPSDLKRAFGRFQDDQMTHHAAAVTYYSLLSLFPALLFAVAVLGLFGEQGLVTDAAGYLREIGAPDETVEAITSFLQSAVDAKATAAGALVIGLLTSLYGASGAFSAVGRALNVVWRVEEGRDFVRRKLYDIGWTVLVIALVLVTFVLVFLGGGLATDVLEGIGLGKTAAAIWAVARWPVALCTALLLYAIVYWAAPNVHVERFHWITPGSLLGVSAWLLASAAFFLYAANFSSYNKTYGAFAGVVILLVWMWLSNVVLLFGAELNAAIRVRRTPDLPPTYEGPPLPARVPAKT